MIDWAARRLAPWQHLLPEVSAASVVQLRNQMYPGQTLTAADAHYHTMPGGRPVTYLPIPPGAGGSFAGLFTVDLPASVRYGNQFDILVSRITTQQVVQPAHPIERSRLKRRVRSRRISACGAHIRNFLARVSVQPEGRFFPRRKLLAIQNGALTLRRQQPLVPGTGLRYISYLLRPNRWHGRPMAAKIPCISQRL